MISAEGITYVISGTRLLDDVSFEIAAGEVAAVLGPNGAGKSTLLKCLAGDLEPARGRIRLDGRDIADFDLTELAMRRAVLSQSVPVTFPFTVEEIVAMGRAPYGGDGAVSEQQRVVQVALDRVDAAHLRGRIFPSLSGGEQQRVHLARVLAQLWSQDRAYLFLDEPTAALDLKHQHQVLGLARSLAGDCRFAVCVILHDVMLASRYADTVCLLKGGRVAAAGPAAEVLTPGNIETVFDVDSRLVLPAVA